MTPALVHLLWVQLIAETRASESSELCCVAYSYRTSLPIVAGRLGDYGV